MSYQHFFETLKPDSQETAKNFEKRVLQKCLRITFCTYKPVNPFHFLKKHQNRCTLLPSAVHFLNCAQTNGGMQSKAYICSENPIIMYTVPELKFMFFGSNLLPLICLNVVLILGNYAREDLIISFCFVYTSLSCLDK